MDTISNQFRNNEGFKCIKGLLICASNFIPDPTKRILLQMQMNLVGSKNLLTIIVQIIRMIVGRPLGMNTYIQRHVIGL